MATGYNLHLLTCTVPLCTSHSVSLSVFFFFFFFQTFGSVYFTVSLFSRPKSNVKKEGNPNPSRSILPAHFSLSQPPFTKQQEHRRHRPTLIVIGVIAHPSSPILKSLLTLSFSLSFSFIAHRRHRRSPSSVSSQISIGDFQSSLQVTCKVASHNFSPSPTTSNLQVTHNFSTSPHISFTSDLQAPSEAGLYKHRSAMLKIKTPKTRKGVRELEKRAPKLVENSKKTLILHGTKTSNVLNAVLTQIFHLKRDNAIRYTKKNDSIRPFENGGEASLEFFSQKTDCSIFLFGSHSKKRPNNLVMGRMYDHHVYDLVEVGVENFKSLETFVYDKKVAPKAGSKPFFAFIGEGFESVAELKHLKEVLLDMFRGEVVENLNLAGVDRVFVCTAISSTTVFFTHCALCLKKSGTSIPRMELVEVGPSMDLVVRRHRPPNDGLNKEAMRTAAQLAKKKMKNVSSDAVLGKIGKIYMPDQQVGGMALSQDVKGLKRERRESKKKTSDGEDKSKKRKKDSQ